MDLRTCVLNSGYPQLNYPNNDFLLASKNPHRTGITVSPTNEKAWQSRQCCHRFVYLDVSHVEFHVFLNLGKVAYHVSAMLLMMLTNSWWWKQILCSTKRNPFVVLVTILAKQLRRRELWGIVACVCVFYPVQISIQNPWTSFQVQDSDT